MIHFHLHDLPGNISFGPIIAIDCESMGLHIKRDRLCLVQLTDGQGEIHLVQFDQNFHAPHLKKLLSDTSKLKLFHFGRFDIAMIFQYLNILVQPVYCTKIASKLSRTYTDRHGLKDLVQELLGQNLSKTQQTSYWGAEKINEDQKHYAAQDVIYLHRLKEILDKRLARENRLKIAQKCFDFLPFRAQLDVMGWPEHDIFSHGA